MLTGPALEVEGNADLERLPDVRPDTHRRRDPAALMPVGIATDYVAMPSHLDDVVQLVQTATEALSTPRVIGPRRTAADGSATSRSDVSRPSARQK